MAIGLNHNTQTIRPGEELFLQVGSIFSNGRSTPPTGYLLCDGSAVSRTDFANLFGAIGTIYGTGNGSTTFNIPDLKGVTTRGAGTSVGYTENVTVTLGTKINDAVQDHAHTITPYGATAFVFPIANFGGTQSNIGPGSAWYLVEQYIAGMNSGRSANETRVKSLGINFFIKY
jgi:microcystin-dependent protein